MKVSAKPRKPYWGLARRQERLGLTRRGWMVLLVLILASATLTLRGLHGFLAMNAPNPGGALVVEGWLPDYALERVFKELKKGAYTKVYVTGLPLDTGSYLSEYKTYAEVGTATLLKLGVPKTSIQAVPGPDTRKDRTYTSARALQAWFDAHQTAPEAITVVSLGPHARRTRLLFEKGLLSNIQVGILAIEDRDYLADQWWKFSAGVRNVIDEAIAYTYARLFFWPAKSS